MITFISLRNPRVKWTLCILVITLVIYISKDLFPTTLQDSEYEEPWISSSIRVHFWIDIPNEFPWRSCIQEYNRVLTLLSCDQASEAQRFLLEPLKSIDSGDNAEQKFHWKTSRGLCIVPGMTMHEGVLKETLLLNDTCHGGGFWRWTEEGQIQWSEGGL